MPAGPGAASVGLLEAAPGYGSDVGSGYGIGNPGYGGYAGSSNGVSEPPLLRYENGTARSRRSLLAQVAAAALMDGRPGGGALKSPGQGAIRAPVPNGHAHGAASEAATCYCRYDARRTAWALNEGPCRAGLLRRCSRSSDALLRCSSVEAAYGVDGSEAVARAAVSAFLFVDCPAAPPCACAALASTPQRNAAAAVRSRLHASCCAELQTHCQTPFSGLECTAVVRFCSAPPARALEDAAIAAFALVRTHRSDCRSAGAAAARGDSVGSQAQAQKQRKSAADVAALQRVADALLLPGVVVDEDAERGVTVSGGGEEEILGMHVLVLLVACCVAIGMAATGALGLLRSLSSPAPGLRS